MTHDVDAVVIGSGPNGLVAAAMLADAGWSVLVCEASPVAGGAVASAEVTAPGFTSDLYSSFHPLAAVSPPMRALGLERYGLSWSRAELAVANTLPDGGGIAVGATAGDTAQALDALHPGDGAGWLTLHERWRTVRAPLVRSLLDPFPPVRRGLSLASSVGVGELLRFARFGLLPARRLAAEHFTGEAGGLLVTGNSLHTDLGPDDAVSGIFGWLLAMLAQDVGFPTPTGGTGMLARALVARAEAAGAVVTTGQRVQRVLLRGGRAVGVQLASGEQVSAARAVVADVGAPALYLGLVGTDELPPRLRDDLTHFAYDHGVVKVDWALSGPVPWRSEVLRRSGVVHVGDSFADLGRYCLQLNDAMVPDRPWLLVGQMTTADPTRSPAGTESAWAYTHVPHPVRGDAGPDGLTGTWDERETSAFVARMEAEMELRAPGFADLVLARHVATPTSLQSADGNLVGGATNGGTAALHQQLVFRPTVGLGRSETPFAGLYLASASAHPGGGVHGAAGATAARAALSQSGWLGSLRGRAWRGAAAAARGD